MANVNTPILKNLNAAVTYAKQRYENGFIWQDIVLNTAFRNAYKQYLSTKSCTIDYHEHTSVVTTRAKQFLFIDNEWFAIASYFVDFCTELLTYREYYMKICQRLCVDPKAYAEHLRSLATLSDKSKFQEAALHILKEDFPGRSDYEDAAQYLWQFASDYDWWHGSKTIDRHDFYVSAVLNQLNIVNASHGYVADIVFAYASDYNLRRLVESLDSFTINASSREYTPTATEQEAYTKAEHITLQPSTSRRTLSISAASLERFHATE